MKLDHFTHDPWTQEVLENNTFNVMVDKFGYLFVTTQTSGLHVQPPHGRSGYEALLFRC
ncbi:MAG: hypothetical protein IPP37_22860 [Saprospiraceae bacterium]|nr:hypothetical protein [Saprospiraceae bacterium]